MKKLSFIVMLLLVCVFAFTACGQEPAAQPQQSSEEPAPAVEGEVYEFRLATHYNIEHAGYAALDRIVKELDEKSDGAIQITLYPSSQLGDYTLTFEELMEGTVDMALIPIPSEYDQRLEMNFIPYLVSSYDDMETAFGSDSYFFQEYTNICADLNIKLLGIYVEGLIGLGFVDYPENYADPSASKSMMIRCPAIEVYNLVTEDMGFSASTIPYADLYTSMQTGVVDGWIGGTPQLNYTDFRDVIKYYVPYNVFAENIGFFMSQDVFNEVPAEYQTMIEDAFMEEAIYSYQVSEELDADALAKMEEYGIEIIHLTDEEMAAYVEKVMETTWPKLGGNIGDDVLENLIEAMK